MIKPYIAKNRTEALDAIQSDEHRFVQLDYADGGRDIAELGMLGKKHNVSVMYLSQVRVQVDSVEALEKELEQPTYQYRYIEAQFDLSDDEYYRYNALAKKVGVVLVRNVERIYAL